jgi:type I site-specific restriction-modification system R (restriction) subunit
VRGPPWAVPLDGVKFKSAVFGKVHIRGEPSTSDGQKTERVRVVDWEHPVNNDFLLVSQLSVTGALYVC